MLSTGGGVIVIVASIIDGGGSVREEAVALIAWLSSDQSNFVTGAYYPINYN
jgi:hypothetical protein